MCTGAKAGRVSASLAEPGQTHRWISLGVMHRGRSSPARPLPCRILKTTIDWMAPAKSRHAVVMSSLKRSRSFINARSRSACSKPGQSQPVVSPCFAASARRVAAGAARSSLLSRVRFAAARDAFGASIAGSEALEERISALEEKEKAVLKDWERFCAELSESRRAAAPLSRTRS